MITWPGILFGKTPSELDMLNLAKTAVNDQG